jgi:hypothetical protein
MLLKFIGYCSDCGCRVYYTYEQNNSTPKIYYTCQCFKNNFVDDEVHDIYDEFCLYKKLNIERKE